jgi:hypothetical protein
MHSMPTHATRGRAPNEARVFLGQLRGSVERIGVHRLPARCRGAAAVRTFRPWAATKVTVCQPSDARIP